MLEDIDKVRFDELMGVAMEANVVGDVDGGRLRKTDELVKEALGVLDADVIAANPMVI